MVPSYLIPNNWAAIGQRIEAGQAELHPMMYWLQATTQWIPEQLDFVLAHLSPHVSETMLKRFLTDVWIQAIKNRDEVIFKALLSRADLAADDHDGLAWAAHLDETLFVDCILQAGPVSTQGLSNALENAIAEEHYAVVQTLVAQFPSNHFNQDLNGLRSAVESGRVEMMAWLLPDRLETFPAIAILEDALRLRLPSAALALLVGKTDRGLLWSTLMQQHKWSTLDALTGTMRPQERVQVLAKDTDHRLPCMAEAALRQERAQALHDMALAPKKRPRS